MDNDLMARRLRPPSEPSRPGDAPFIPPPAPAPWEPTPAPWAATQTEAPLNQVPWDGPAAPTSDGPSRDDEWPNVDLTSAQPPDAGQAAPSGVEAPRQDADAGTRDGAPGTNSTPQSRTPAPEMPWDRPAPALEQTDAQAGGATWDTPAPFAVDDEPSFLDDRPVEMLDDYDGPAAVAATAPAAALPGVAEADAPVEKPAAAGEASVVVAPDPGDPYDADAPVVPEAARLAFTPSWPTSNGRPGGGHEVAFPQVAATQQPLEIEPETPAPWATDRPITQQSAEAPPAQASADSAAAQSERHPATAALEEDEPAWAPSDLQADGQVEAQGRGEFELLIDSNADTATQLESLSAGWAQAETVAPAQPETVSWTPADTEQWAAPVDAITTESEDATPPVEESAQDAGGDQTRSAGAEPQTLTQVFTVPIDAAALAKGPTTLVATGPEAGLPGNLVLRIELAIVDDAKPAPPALSGPPAVEQGRATEPLPASVDKDSHATPAAAHPAAPRFTDQSAEGPWPTVVDQSMDFAAKASIPDAAQSTFEPGQASSDPWVSVAPPAATSYFEAPAAVAEASEPEPHIGSVDDSDQWWVSPPQVQPPPRQERVADGDARSSHPLAAPRLPDAPRPAQSPAPTADAQPGSAWPSGPANDDLSSWPPVWEAAQGSEGTAVPDQGGPGPAAEPFDWGWPAATALPGGAPASESAHSEVFAPPAWPATVRPLTPAPPAAAAPAPSAASAAAPRVTTIEAAQDDLWFLAAEPAPASDEAADATAGEVRPQSSLLTVGMTVGMAVVVVVLVLVFVQLMTSLLR